MIHGAKPLNATKTKLFKENLTDLKKLLFSINIREQLHVLHSTPVWLRKMERLIMKIFQWDASTYGNCTEYEISQFVNSREKDLIRLLENIVFENFTNRRLMDTKFVDIIKNEGTPNSYKKSRLLVQEPLPHNVCNYPQSISVFMFSNWSYIFSCSFHAIFM